MRHASRARRPRSTLATTFIDLLDLAHENLALVVLGCSRRARVQSRSSARTAVGAAPTRGGRGLNRAARLLSRLDGGRYFSFLPGRTADTAPDLQPSMSSKAALEAGTGGESRDEACSSVEEVLCAASVHHCPRGCRDRFGRSSRPPSPRAPGPEGLPVRVAWRPDDAEATQEAADLPERQVAAGPEAQHSRAPMVQGRRSRLQDPAHGD